MGKDKKDPERDRKHHVKYGTGLIIKSKTF
jgi:hypothetical protein